MIFSSYHHYALLILAMMSGLYLIAQLKKDNGIVDIFWGLGFCVLALAGFIFSSDAHPRQLLILGMVLVWGLRLAGYLARRNLGKGEDFRYAAWRKEWGQNAWWRAFLQVFMLQGFFMWVIALPVFHVMSYDQQELGWTDAAGFSIWLIGWLTETVADRQMAVFKSGQANKGKLMDSGLWSISRHPNYLGEIMLWWGIFMVALSAERWYISLISPLVITWLLTSVSGVPMLEAKYKGRADFEAYKSKVPALIPRAGALLNCLKGAGKCK